MARSTTTVRPARSADADRLVEVWDGALRDGERTQRLADVHATIAEAEADPACRILVAESEGEVIGAVYLRLAEITPLNRDLCVQVISPHVRPGFRRRGVGHALMEAAVQFAEESGVGHLATAAETTSRDANRFLARLGLGPSATFRIAPVAVVRTKLTGGRVGGRTAQRGQLSQVLAARRSLRRREATRSAR